MSLRSPLHILVISLEMKYKKCVIDTVEKTIEPAGYAESKNELTWERKDIDVGIYVFSSDWDSEMICYPFVLEHKGEKYMLYNGYGKTGFELAVLDSE